MVLWWFTIMPSVLAHFSLATWIKFPLGQLIFTLPLQPVSLHWVRGTPGYAILIYTSFLFLLTTRDVEIGGALRQLRVSFRDADVSKPKNTILLYYESIRMAHIQGAFERDKKWNIVADEGFGICFHSFGGNND